MLWPHFPLAKFAAVMSVSMLFVLGVAEPSAVAEHCPVERLPVCIPHGGETKPKPSPQPPRPSPTPVNLPRLQFDWRPIEELEADLLSMINAERAKEGLPPVLEEPLLSDVARAHSATMGAKGYIWHNMDFVAWARRTGAKGIGENVDLNVTPDGSHEAFMNSPGHRRNILDPRFTHAGIGVWREPAPYGFVFVTEDFVRLEGWEVTDRQGTVQASTTSEQTQETERRPMATRNPPPAATSQTPQPERWVAYAATAVAAGAGILRSAVLRRRRKRSCAF